MSNRLFGAFASTFAFALLVLAIPTSAHAQLVTVSMTDNKTEAAPGTELTYAIRVTSALRGWTLPVQLNDTLPKDVTFVSASNGGALVGNTSTVRWNNLRVAGTMEVTLKVRVKQGTKAGTVLKNTAKAINASATDSTTVVQAQCQDGVDNDKDGAVDSADFSCANADDDDETNTKSQCQDGIDNDGDGAIDANDFSCASAQDNDETNGKSQCQDGIDNDNDGVTDGDDFSCGSAQDNDETNDKAQCQDGIDNDNDGAVDGKDFSCASAQDNDETNTKAQCQDGVDNDDDGKIDAQDAGCESTQDNDEYNAPPAVSVPLSIAVKNMGTTDTLVKNQKNVPLFVFEGRAGSAMDVFLTKLVFTAQAGSLNNAQNYALWVDTDASGEVDTILLKDISAQNGAVTFVPGTNKEIEKDTTVRFEVHADISSSQTNNTLQLAFAEGTTYVEAENGDTGASLVGIKTDGVCASTCDIVVTTQDSKLYTIYNQGNLFVRKDSTPTRHHQVLGGILSDTLLRLALRAEHEAIDVTDFQISNFESVANSIDRLELYREGETTPFAAATVGGCGTDIIPSQKTFCANMENRQLVVPKDQEVDVLVRARIKTDDQGAVLAEPIVLFINGKNVADNSTGEGAVRARGDVSSNNLLASDGDKIGEGEIFLGLNEPGASRTFVGSSNVVVFAKLESITNANLDADGSQIPVGVSQIGQFKFKALSNANTKNGINRFVLNDIFFNVDATNVQINTILGSFTFYNKADPSVVAVCTPLKLDGTSITGLASGQFLVGCGSFVGTSVNTEVSDEATFVLQANIVNPFAGANPSLQVSLQNFSSIDALNFGVGTQYSHIRWLDKDAGASASFVWIDSPETTIKSTKYQG